MHRYTIPGRRLAVAWLGVLLSIACGDGSGPGDPLDGQLRAALAEAGVVPLQPLPASDPALVQLGRALMFDKELSANRDISCATCHHPTFRTVDGLSLSVGTGGSGAGPARTPGAGRQLVPRNSQELFNRGYPHFTSMFWDGRVAAEPGGGFHGPGGVVLPPGLSGVLAAQAMIPVTTRLEMRGEAGDPNELGPIADADLPAIWAALMARVLAFPEYVALFQAAYPSVPTGQLGFQHAANAIAAFQVAVFTTIQSPFDHYLAGDDAALSQEAKRGGLLFFGRARCSECHLGSQLTDQQFHNIGVPQIGPGFGAESPQDFGRGRVTGAAGDRYAFRTPALRNVDLTGPWMHDGAYTTLEAAVRHYIDVPQALAGYDVSQLPPDLQPTYQGDAPTIDAILATLDSRVADPLDLSDGDISQIVAFLRSLTDPAALDLSAQVPASVPSGLPVGD